MKQVLGLFGRPVGTLNHEIARFQRLGFTLDEARSLARLYDGMGHHAYIGFSFANRIGLPTWIRDSVFNLLKPRGINYGRFYELHYMVDLYGFHGTAIFRSIPGSVWRGADLGLTKYGFWLRNWFGMPTIYKSTGGIVIGGTGASRLQWNGDCRK